MGTTGADERWRWPAASQPWPDPERPEPTPAPTPQSSPTPSTPLFPTPDQLDRLSTFGRLFERRMVFLRGALEGDKADEVAAQLLALDAESADPVTLYIDSPGGDTFGMFAVHDTLQLMRSPVHTRCAGMAASAAAFLLATGTGTRSATPNARIMIHQPLGGGRGTASDIQILAREFVLLRERMEQILADRTGQPVERISRDTQRDFWMSAAEAVEYGLIDEIAGPLR